MIERLERLLENNQNVSMEQAPVYFNADEASAWASGFQRFREMVLEVLNGEDLENSETALTGSH